MAKTLIIIDMQPYFPTAQNEETIAEVIKLVKKARRDHQPIIVVEYELTGYSGARHNGDDATQPSIMQEVCQSDRWITLRKRGDDGSLEIITSAAENGISLEHCVVCGVNTSYCVRATVEGLAAELPDGIFEVSTKACNCAAGYDNEEIINRYANSQIRAA